MSLKYEPASVPPLNQHTGLQTENMSVNIMSLYLNRGIINVYREITWPGRGMIIGKTTLVTHMDEHDQAPQVCRVPHSLCFVCVVETGRLGPNP